MCLLDPPSLQIWALKWENLPGEEKYRPRLQHVTLAARDSDGCVNIERCVFCLTALIWSQIHMPREAARHADRPFYHEWYSTEELIDPSHSAHTQMHRLVAVSYLKWSGFWKSYWLRGRGGGGGEKERETRQRGRRRRDKKKRESVTDVTWNPLSLLTWWWHGAILKPPIKLKITAASEVALSLSFSYVTLWANSDERTVASVRISDKLHILSTVRIYS